tara:strand:- start:829 stop:1062 length:234 start_codon:yes stop_codon:yes gene_type:complete
MVILLIMIVKPILRKNKLRDNSKHDYVKYNSLEKIKIMSRRKSVGHILLTNKVKKQWWKKRLGKMLEVKISKLLNYS